MRTPEIHPKETPQSLTPAGRWLADMCAFYNTFPYPGRSLLLLPEVSRMLHSHAGFAALLQLGDAEWARRIWTFNRVQHPVAGSPRLARLVIEAACAQQPKERILLAGCGTDEPVLHGALHPEASIDAVDLSKRSLRRARLKWLGYRLLHPFRTFQSLLVGWGKQRGNGVHFFAGDAAGFMRQAVAGGNLYDHVVCFGVLHHQRNPREMLDSLIDGLAKGGTLRIMVYSKTGRQLERASQHILAKAGASTTAGLAPGLLGLLGLRFKARRLQLWLLGSRISGFFASNQVQSGTGPRVRPDLRFGYMLRGGSARIADGLLHPCDPGLDPGDVVSWAQSRGCELLFCCARSHLLGDLVGIAHPLGTWAQIIKEEASGNLVSNIEMIFARHGSCAGIVNAQ